MAMSNFGRVIEVMTAGMTLRSADFNIEGSVPFDNDAVPNEAEIKVWNLSSSTVSKIKRGAVLLLKAGYTGDVGTILHGYISKAATVPSGPDKITTIHVLDGPDLSVRKTTSKAYAKGTLGSYILRDLAGMLGLPIGQMDLIQDYRYMDGYTADGEIIDKMEDVAKDCGTSLYVNKGRLYIRSLRRGADKVFALSQATGLIGSPEPLEDGAVSGYTVRSQLQHRITTASVIDLKSESFSGRLYVRSGQHSFSRTGDFITEMEAIQ